MQNEFTDVLLKITFTKIALKMAFRAVDSIFS